MSIWACPLRHLGRLAEPPQMTQRSGLLWASLAFRCSAALRTARPGQSSASPRARARRIPHAKASASFTSFTTIARILSGIVMPSMASMLCNIVPSSAEAPVSRNHFLHVILNEVMFVYRIDSHFVLSGNSVCLYNRRFHVMLNGASLFLYKRHSHVSLSRVSIRFTIDVSTSYRMEPFFFL